MDQATRMELSVDVLGKVLALSQRLDVVVMESQGLFGDPSDAVATNAGRAHSLAAGAKNLVMSCTTNLGLRDSYPDLLQKFDPESLRFHLDRVQLGLASDMWLQGRTSIAATASGYVVAASEIVAQIELLTSEAELALAQAKGVEIPQAEPKETVLNDFELPDGGQDLKRS